ncbi:WD40 repeat protein [Teratosphaeria destructans]|uniref:WD40 repeat protein n=1 Tax=Teratosphaeria destructans TaxID=418781 RepID=A0A9W7SR10_9PEZI|nr:WD40 repeat protein [Teratosphaeria destructans]
MTERYATLRGPAPTSRPVGRTSTLVADARRSDHRTVSEGAIWTVGSTLVTEGVPSTPNGRGGRVTSGTSAPHYTADFLRKVSTHDEEECHGRRLALAMGMDRNARLLDHSSPISNLSAPSSASSNQNASGSRIWRDGIWERASPVSPTKSPIKKVKDVPVIPFRVLDAPALRDDYYCSLLAYSPTLDCLAVGLGPHVYLWSEDRQRYTSKLPDSLTAPFSAHITSLSFSSVTGGSAVLAIGRADGRITLWSPLDRDPRFDSEQPSAMSFVCFRPNTVRRQSVRESCATVATEELLVSDEAGNVYLYSVEWPDHDQRDLFDWHGSMTLLARISCHSQQVCGIAWSLDGEFFATGGNDNQLFLFESKKVMKQHRRRQQAQGSEDTVKVRSGDQDSLDSVAGQGAVLNILPGHQKHIFTLNAAVRALAFAPWQPSLLAAGGGSNDRCIHFFHTVSGARLATIDCHAQVTSLIWSQKRKEIAATFGFAQPEHKIRVAVFSWPSCRCVVKIPWVAEERALHSVAYPRGPAGGLSKRGTTDDREGGPWYGKRTREEGCLVVATSDASIKFHELWAERDGTESRSPMKGVLGGSQILEGACSSEVESWGAIR